MSKNRMVDTIFWEDNYSAELDPTEKLLFLYFLTNSSTEISGVYQITLKKVAVETGIDKEMVEKILVRFSDDNKIFFIDGWIIISNFVKHQNHKSPTIIKGIVNNWAKLPENVKSFILAEVKGIDTLSHLIKLNLIKSNLIKENIKAFAIPSLSDVSSFILEKKIKVDAEAFINFYNSNGWKVGANPMTDWRAAILNWEKRKAKENSTNSTLVINTK